MAPAIKAWLLDTEFPHMSTFGGNELGCVATTTVCDITSRPSFRVNVLRLIEQFREGFSHAHFRVNQVGLCMDLFSETMDSYVMTRKEDATTDVADAVLEQIIVTSFGWRRQSPERPKLHDSGGPCPHHPGCQPDGRSWFLGRW